jgi:hypothetical protein
MSEANRDQNRVTTIIGTSSSDGETPVNIYVDAVTGELFVKTVSGITSIDKFSTNDIVSASSTVTYIGMEESGGDWYIKKIDTSSGTSFGHATENNNSTYTTYATAWAARASLTYQNYSLAF